MPTERQLTVDQACAEIARLQISRRIDIVIVHHTWEPSAGDYRGISTVAGIGRTHARWWPIRNDHGYQILFGPSGEVFFCCPFNKVGAHCKYHNSHSIGVSYIADFGGGEDERAPLDNPATYAGLAAGQRVVAALCERFDLGPDDVHFHTEFNRGKTCPGELMNLANYREAVREFMSNGLKVVSLPGSEPIACRPQIEDGVTRVDLRPLAQALGFEVYDHIADQGKVYLRKPHEEGGDTNG